MNQSLVVVFFVILALLWGMLVPLRIRNKIMPWALCLLLFNGACSAVMTGLLRAFYAIGNYSSFAILNNGYDVGRLNRNLTWRCFLVFWAYMVLSCFLGSYVYEGVFFWFNVLFTSFSVGYFLSTWVMRTEGALGKLLWSVTLISCFIMLVYLQKGGLAVVETTNPLNMESARAGLNEDYLADELAQNVNSVALQMLCLIPWLLVAMLFDVRSRHRKFLRVIAGICLVLAGIVLVRTGARNGAVGLLPSIWYFLFSATKSLERWKRFAAFALLSVVFCVAVAFVMRDAPLRFINFFVEQETSGYRTTEDAITSGRVGMWQRQWEMMSPVQKIFGRGMATYDVSAQTGRVHAGNAHSMFMTVFYNSGFVGIALFAVVVFLCVKHGFKCGDRGRIALLFIGTWFFSGAGESWGMIGGTTALLAGFGMGLLIDKRQITNSEFLRARSVLPVLISDIHNREVRLGLVGRGK